MQMGGSRCCGQQGELNSGKIKINCCLDDREDGVLS